MEEHLVLTIILLLCISTTTNYSDLDDFGEKRFTENECRESLAALFVENNKIY